VYRSDGLKISGMMNVPVGNGPFPVVVLCHGYIEPSRYATGDGTWRQADYLAEHGYLTLAPDYRNHGASDIARSFFHIGYAEDVLHLIASIPSLDKADPRRVGLWGHSMGGAIALKAAVVSKTADAVVLFGSVSGDERVNYANGMGNGPGVYGIELLGSPRSNPLVYKRMSPIRYLQYSPPLSIHHGEADSIVPADWSKELYAAALEQGAPAELYLYPKGGHTLRGEDWEQAMERTLAFLDRHVK
jgi:dipeptidyl aminopeptidase/acylaminoacyl peptidase